MQHRSLTIRIGVLAASLFVSACSHAQREVLIDFPGVGAREVWIGDATGKPSRTPLEVKESGVSLAVPTNAKEPFAFVLDKGTGNLAFRRVSQLEDGKWTVRDAEYTRIGRVQVAVESGGNQVAAARVELQDTARKQEDFVDPSSEGRVTFWNVAPGEIRLTVRTKTDGKDNEPVVQVFRAELRRSEAEPVFTVAVPEGVDVLNGAQKTDAPTDKALPTGAEPKRETFGGPPNAIGQIFGYLFGLGLVGAIVYFAIQYAKKNPDQVSQKLKNLGVQIPEPGAQTPPDPAPPVPAKPAPQPQILLGDGPVSAPIAQPIQRIGEPRLIAETGDAIELDEGECVVGRDAGLGLSLTEEQTVSRRHAGIIRSGLRVSVVDYGSTNGTYVNGQKVGQETILRPGDVVQFGAIRFRYEA